MINHNLAVSKTRLIFCTLLNMLFLVFDSVILFSFLYVQLNVFPFNILLMVLCQQLVSPGLWLCDLTLERYEVREKKVSKKVRT
jgi:hypothetical protein